MNRIRSLRRLWEPFTACHASLYAAGASFYILLSIFPTALFLLTLLPYLPLSLQALVEAVEQVVPAPFHPVIDYVFDTVESRSTVTLLSLSVLTTLWSASKGVLAIADGLNAVLDRDLETRYLRRRLSSIVYFLILAVALLTMLLLHVFGEALLAACARWFPAAARAAAVIYHLRTPYLLFLFGLLFALIFYLFPRRAMEFRWCLAGGLATAGCWLFISWAFSIYVNQYAGYVKLYGGIGLLLLTCVWLHICLLLFLYGARATSLLHQRSYHPLTILRETFSRRS